MKQLYYAGLFVVAGLLTTLTADAQKQNLTPYQRLAVKQHTLPGREIICPAGFIDAFTKTGVVNNRSARTSGVNSSTFIVEYTGFTPDAQKAFQYAVDIWSTLISSPIPIRIKAQWTALGSGVLGSANPFTTRVGTDGTQWAFGQYPVALAEKIARRPLNDPAEADIQARFSNQINWYFGTDGNTPKGQYDLVTVVLHEIAHGLGFTGDIRATSTKTTADYGFPSPFDHFVENATGQRLVNGQVFTNGSAALLKQITGGNLYFNGPIVQQRDGQRPRLYAPTVYSDGSTLYHMDEATYPAGNINSLMTYAVGTAEAIHTPGPLVLDMFRDIEWNTTSVLHTPLTDQEDVRDLTFQTRIVSDTTVTSGSVKLYYHTGPISGTATPPFTEAPLTQTAAGQFAYTLPAAQAQGTIQYYFRAQDASGRTFSNPGKNLTGGQVYYQIVTGPDNVPPRVTHSPSSPLLLTTQTDSIPLLVGVSDDRSFGIDTAYVEYLINGVARPNLPLINPPLDGIDTLYRAAIKFAVAVKAGDRLQYRIIARDKSRAKNQTIKPATGYYEVSFAAPQTAVRTQYSNTFANIAASSADFAGNSFSIAQPTGFPDPAIHSEHNYRNGDDVNYQSNYTYTLLAPIKIKANSDSATMRFDEIVLVEPGEDGSIFGTDAFFDYVIVEGSRDNGKTWLPFQNGYDSRDQADWLATFNSKFTGTGLDRNSAGVGTPALYHRREIGLQNNFQPNETVLIRFRLFADQLSNGWGWAIDNLQIQVPPPPPVLAVAEPINPVGTFLVYPNPATTGSLRIDAQLANPVAEAGLSVQNSAGQTLRQQTLTVGGTSVKTQLDLTQLPAGLYFLKLQAGDAVLTKKVLITK